MEQEVKAIITMGYFSNSTEGDMYYQKYCSHCVHEKDDPNDSNGCVIWTSHLLHNYDMANDDKHVLHEFIPLMMDKDLGYKVNQKCKMFISKTDGK